MRLGVGLHPWWAADGRCGNDDAFLAANLIRKTRFVGEIGLDASPKHVSVSSLPLQIEMFKMLCSASAEYSDPYARKVLSIHSVKAGTLMLDILEQLHNHQPVIIHRDIKPSNILISLGL